jgi:hypothetical protein
LKDLDKLVRLNLSKVIEKAVEKVVPGQEC